jgi:hypothetical protein
MIADIDAIHADTFGTGESDYEYFLRRGRELRAWKDGEPCPHPGCLSHVTHPCDGCGRVGGKWPEPK